MPHSRKQQEQPPPKPKPSLFDKSYKTLFILYAPIALSIYLYQFVHGVKINLLFVLAGVGAILSFAVGLLISALLVKHHKKMTETAGNTHHPLLRPRFFLFFLPAMLLTFAITTGFLVGRPGIHKTVTGAPYSQRETIPIIILINARDEYGGLLETSLKTMQGFSYFILNYPEQLTRYQFEFYDHHNLYNQALKDYVSAEIASGTGYFVCLSSEVCEPLSRDFGKLAAASPFPESPLLITTVAASSGIVTRPNQSYLFFPQTTEMAEKLTQVVRKENFSRVSWIAANTVYGEQLTSAFRQDLRAIGKTAEDGLLLNKENTAVGWRDRVELSDLVRSRPEAVLVGHSENINLALAVLPKETVLLVPLGYTELLRPLPAELEQRRIIALLPVYRSGRFDEYSYRAAFFAFTLDKLIYTIERARMTGTSFHDIWMETNYPPQVAFEVSGPASFRFFLRAVDIGAPPGIIVPLRP